MTTNNRITAILAYLRESITSIYVWKKLDQIEDEENIQDWEKFVREIKTMFSDKSKAADAEQKIKIFKQGKKHIANFMIKFEALAMKAEIYNIHTIFLLKENVRMDIIKMILKYLLIVTQETLREQKMVITLVGQKYESIESQQDYRTSIEITYRGKDIFIDIEKTKNNFDKDGRPRCFNCNIYKYMAKKYQRLKKEQDMRKCYKCDKVGHITKDCRSEQKIKNWSIQEELDEEKDNKQKDFAKGLKQV